VVRTEGDDIPACGLFLGVSFSDFGDIVLHLFTLLLGLVGMLEQVGVVRSCAYLAFFLGRFLAYLGLDNRWSI